MVLINSFNPYPDEDGSEIEIEFDCFVNVMKT